MMMSMNRCLYLVAALLIACLLPVAQTEAVNADTPRAVATRSLPTPGITFMFQMHPRRSAPIDLLGILFDGEVS